MARWKAFSSSACVSRSAASMALRRSFTSATTRSSFSRDGRTHLRFARGHEYLVGFPVQATCRGCGTLNNATAPAR